MKKTHTAKPAQVSRAWHLLDAKGVSLGRLSTEAAELLCGKRKVDFTPHVDAGDFVVIINAKDIKITGNKAIGKVYYRHSGFPGGIKSQKLADLQQKDPAAVIQNSIRGMLPVNRLRPARLARLKVYNSSEHPHAGQLGSSGKQIKDNEAKQSDES